MRKITPSFSLVLCVLAFAAGAACDDGGGGDDTPAADAAPPEPDGNAGGADAAPGTLTVHARSRNGGDPVEGATVVAHAADGTVKTTTTTDAAGSATIEVADGDLVTTGWAEVSKGTSITLHTVAGVAPGDVIYVGPPSDGNGSPIATIAVTTPGDFAGAAGYQLSAGNGDYFFPGTPLAAAQQLQVSDYLRSDTTSTSVLLRARNGTNELAYAVSAMLPLAGTPMVSFAAWRTDFHEFDSLVTGAGVPSANIFFETRLFGAAGEFHDFQEEPQPVGGTPTRTARYDLPMDLATSWAHAVYVSSGGGERWVVAKGAWPIANQTRALDTDFSASVIGVTIDSTTTPARPTVSFTQGTDGPTAHDAVIVGIGYNVAKGGNAEWMAVLPPGTTSFQFPPLPAPLDDFAYDGLGSFYGGGAATVDTDAGTYALLRGVLSILPNEGLRQLLVYLGAAPSGTVRISLGQIAAE